MSVFFCFCGFFSFFSENKENLGLTQDTDKKENMVEGQGGPGSSCSFWAELYSDSLNLGDLIQRGRWATQDGETINTPPLVRIGITTPYRSSLWRVFHGAISFFLKLETKENFLEKERTNAKGYVPKGAKDQVKVMEAASPSLSRWPKGYHSRLTRGRSWVRAPHRDPDWTDLRLNDRLYSEFVQDWTELSLVLY